jgi:uncharacterized protein Yka (UPF0111/DUF47 family)
MSHWFLPHTPDLIGLLQAQAAVTVKGMDAFAAWSAGDLARAADVRTAEHEADDARRRVQLELRAAFSTPIDPEDIYELSQGLDVVLNAAKNAVREAEVMRITPDGALGEMAAKATEGVRHIANALPVLTKGGDAATAEADAAIKCERQIEHLYRTAMSKLCDIDDIGQVTAWREMYRRYARLGEALVHVAERVWYAVVKEA